MPESEGGSVMSDAHGQCLTDTEIQAFLRAQRPNEEQSRHIEWCGRCTRRANVMSMPILTAELAELQAEAHTKWDGTGCPPWILLLHPERTVDLVRREQLTAHIASCTGCTEDIHAMEHARDRLIAESNEARCRRD